MSTVFSTITNGDDAGDEGYSLRNRITTTGGSLGQVRVRFVARSTLSFQADHVSIGVAVTSPTPPSIGAADTQATPVELKFGGLSGFTIAAGDTLTSDWVNLSFNSGDDLIIIIDFGASNGFTRITTTGGHLYYRPTTATYDQSHPTAGGWDSATETLPWVNGFDLIETQSGGANVDLGRVFFTFF